MRKRAHVPPIQLYYKAPPRLRPPSPKKGVATKTTPPPPQIGAHWEGPGGRRMGVDWVGAGLRGRLGAANNGGRLFRPASSLGGPALIAQPLSVHLLHQGTPPGDCTHPATPSFIPTYIPPTYRLLRRKAKTDPGISAKRNGGRRWEDEATRAEAGLAAGAGGAGGAAEDGWRLRKRASEPLFTNTPTLGSSLSAL